MSRARVTLQAGSRDCRGLRPRRLELELSERLEKKGQCQSLGGGKPAAKAQGMARLGAGWGGGQWGGEAAKE